MTTLYIGKEHAYRDEVSAARAESAHMAVHAPRMETLEWDPRLLFRVRWDEKETFTTDHIEVHGLVKAHPDCDVHIVTVA